MFFFFFQLVFFSFQIICLLLKLLSNSNNFRDNFFVSFLLLDYFSLFDHIQKSILNSQLAPSVQRPKANVFSIDRNPRNQLIFNNLYQFFLDRLEKISKLLLTDVEKLMHIDLTLILRVVLQQYLQRLLIIYMISNIKIPRYLNILVRTVQKRLIVGLGGG